MEFKSEQLWPLVLPRLRSYQESHNWDVGLVTSVTNSTVKTVTGWLNGQPPNGERLIKLWHLLAAVGLESPELAKLPAFNRYCGELLTFGVTTMEELQEICNVGMPKSILLMLRGKPPMHPQYDLAELKELYEARLQARRAELMSAPLPEAGPERIEPPSGAPSPARSKGEHLITYAASMLKGVLPLVRQLNSEQSSAVDRSGLRDAVGNDDMFELSNILNDLCSERARDHGRTGQ
jgi:hypothetical protein